MLQVPSIEPCRPVRGRIFFRLAVAPEPRRLLTRAGKRTREEQLVRGAGARSGQVAPPVAQKMAPRFRVRLRGNGYAVNLGVTVFVGKRKVVARGPSGQGREARRAARRATSGKGPTAASRSMIATSRARMLRLPILTTLLLESAPIGGAAVGERQ